MNQEKNILLAIDPGDVESAFVFIDVDTYKPLYFKKTENDTMYYLMDEYIESYKYNDKFSLSVACEMVASYGMSVGKNVFQTCVAIGELSMYFGLMHDTNVEYIYRKDETMNLCGSMRAKDSNVRVALIDRFAKFDFKSGKGTKKNQDWFYGFSADIWAAYACGVTWIDIKKKLYTTIENMSKKPIGGE